MDAAHTAGENSPNGDFLPVSPSDMMFFQALASLTPASPNFTLPPSGRIPFMMQGNSASGSRPQPMILDFTESQVPSSQDPLPEGSVFLDAAADLTVEADVVQGGPRRRRQTASGKNASKPPTKEGVKSRFHRHDLAIVALIEAKKEEQDEDDGRSGHDEVLIVLLMMASFTLLLNLLLEDIFEDISEDEDLRLSKWLKLDIGFSHYEEDGGVVLLSRGTFFMDGVSSFSPSGKAEHSLAEANSCRCLHRLVSDSSYLLCSDHFGIGVSTLQEAMLDVVEAILEDLRPLFLTWPDAVEVQRVSKTFQRRYSLPNVAGAIDGSHIKIKNPERRHARDYFHRKRDISIVLQAICDHDSAFLDISCGAPGSVHDSRCLHLNSIFRRVEAGEVMVDPVLPINDGFQLHPYLLGDQGYAMHPWLMVPFSLTAALEPVLRRERAARSLHSRRQERLDRPDSGHKVRDALVAYVMSKDT
ncbi:hypothetical protein R1flu_026182 [Riccia fluitans]|uniref:DDE Tnp4 domain-containing protein n=1 Tax=Riccia fluitans TaxID=41844 RepID=A0ABD1XF80_9MARC